MCMLSLREISLAKGRASSGQKSISAVTYLPSKRSSIVTFVLPNAHFFNYDVAIKSLENWTGAQV